MDLDNAKNKVIQALKGNSLDSVRQALNEYKQIKFKEQLNFNNYIEQAKSIFNSEAFTTG